MNRRRKNRRQNRQHRSRRPARRRPRQQSDHEAVTYTVTRTAEDWQIAAGGVTIAANDARLPDGDCRARITVRRGDALVFSDRVNLSSSKSRRGFVNALTQKAVALQDGALLALDEAIRQDARSQTES